MYSCQPWFNSRSFIKETKKLNSKKNKQKIELSIEDNGKGFDLHKVLHADSYDRGLGLQSIRQRTELFGGSIDIKSKKGKETTICANWPCQ
jgi:signal transduction histidine kinase